MDDYKKSYLTRQGLLKLKDEFKELKENRIPSIAIKIDEAKQQGDLSENAEYHSAREEMSWAQTRLAELEQILRNVEIIDELNIKSKIIGLGSTVISEINGIQKKFTIVGEHEANPQKGLISNESPLGSALAGSKSGDEINVKTPKGKMIYKIIEIQ